MICHSFCKLNLIRCVVSDFQIQMQFIKHKLNELGSHKVNFPQNAMYTVSVMHYNTYNLNLKRV